MAVDMEIEEQLLMIVRIVLRLQPLLLLFSSSRARLCDPMGYSTPSLPVRHHVLVFAQVHVHCFGDAIQHSHSLMPFFLLPSIFHSFVGTFLFTSDDQNI